MRRDDLQLIYVRVQVLLAPPLSRFRSTELPDLYAELCKRHTLETCTIHGDEGAEFSTEDQLHVDLRRDRLKVSEQVHRGFDIIKKDFADIASVVQEKLSARIFLAPGIDFRALWPLPRNEDASKAMRSAAIALKDDQFDLLEGAKIDTVGITLNAETEDGHLRLEIMPYSSDNTQLFIEVHTHKHDVIQTPAILEQKMSEAYDYFCSTVTKFIESFMPG